jgi:hypothetical protein
MSHVIAANIKEFVTAGKADFTVLNTATGGRFTFQVKAPNKTTEKGGLTTDHEANLRFVKVLTGSDNHSDFTFVGTLFLDNGTFKWSPKSKVGQDAQSVRAFTWLWNRLNQDKDLATVQVWHEGKCGRCGRKLTVPSSIESGFGPECRNHV